MKTKRFLLPVGLSALVLGVHGAPLVTDSHGGAVPQGISVVLPPLYTAFLPVSRTLDALSLLSNPQSIAFFFSILVIALALTALRRSRSPVTIKRMALTLGGTLVALAVVEAAVVFLPRPMARLEVADRDVARVDFHSHTGASHDVSKRFTPERNREWHRSGGFDVAYISDHVKFDGAVAARGRNPRLAGEGTSLLTAVEGRYHRIISTILLGLTEADTALLNRRGNLLPGNTASGRIPITIVALPNRNLDSVTVESLDSLPRFVAIELIDAAPRGLGQLDREEARIRNIAERLRLVLVAASNNHGYGRTVAAWNMMRLPGWRSLHPESVGHLIEDRLRARDQAAVSIVKRTRPGLHGVALAGTLPVILYQMIGSLTALERIVWLAWIWALAAVFYRRR